MFNSGADTTPKFLILQETCCSYVKKKKKKKPKISTFKSCEHKQSHNLMVSQNFYLNQELSHQRIRKQHYYSFWKSGAMVTFWYYFSIYSMSWSPLKYFINERPGRQNWTLQIFLAKFPLMWQYCRDDCRGGTIRKFHIMIAVATIIAIHNIIMIILKNLF